MKTTFRGAFALAGLAVMSVAACGGDSGDESASSVDENNPLFRPAALAEEAPATYQARFETSKGAFTISVTRELAPLGADRFYTLVKNGYYDEVRFFRVIDGFIAQWGMHADPRITAVWRQNPLMDEPVMASNTRGTVTFAMGGPNSRTTQVFVNFRDNANLDDMGFAPFGEVTEGMDVVEQLYSGYGEGQPRGNGPIQQNIMARGNDYLNEGFPDLDYIVSATIVGG